MGAAQVVAGSADVGGTTTASAAELSDGELVAAHLDGDRQAFEALYERYHPRLLAFCRYRTKTQQNAEDVAHDVIVRALTYLEGFERDRPMWPWLKQIATNELADHYRSSSREVDMPDDALHGADPEANEHTVWLAERDALLQAMDSLSPRDRSVLELKYCNDWDSEELQDLLEVERSALYKILQRARNRLHSAYEELADSKLAGLLPAPLVDRLRSWTARVRLHLSDWESGLLSSGASADCLLRTAAAIAIGVSIGATVAVSASGQDAPTEGTSAAPVDSRGLIDFTSHTSAQDVTSPALTEVDTDEPSVEQGTSTSTESTQSNREVSASVSVPATNEPTTSTAQISAEGGEDADNNKTLNRRIESRTGSRELVKHEREATVYCNRSAVAGAACETFDTVDEEAPPTP